MQNVYWNIVPKLNVCSVKTSDTTSDEYTKVILGYGRSGDIAKCVKHIRVEENSANYRWIWICGVHSGKQLEEPYQ